MRRLAWLLLCLSACSAEVPVPSGEVRIISLAPNMTELAYAAGAGSRLVGVSEFSDHPLAARALPRIGNAFLLDYERIVALAPTVALAWESGTPPEAMHKLEQLGIRVITIETRKLEDIALALEALAALAPDPVVGRAAAQSFREGIAALRHRYREQQPVSVFVMIDDAPLYTVGGSHLISEILALCGGRNVFGESSALAFPVDHESVLVRAPEVILSTDDGDPQAYWQPFTGLPAVAGQRVYAAPADALARPGPRLVQGAAAVCALLKR